MGGWGHLAWDWCPMTSRKGTLGSLLLSTLGLTTLHNLIMENVCLNKQTSLEDYWNKLVASAVQVSDCDRDLPVTHFRYSSFSYLFQPPPPPLPFFLLHLFPSSFFTSTSSFPFFPLPPPLSQSLLLLFLQLPDYRDQICDSLGPKLWRSLAKKCGQKYSQTELKCDQKVPHGARQSVSHVTCSHQIGDVLSPHIMLMPVYCVKASMTSDLFLVMFLALKQTVCF